MERFSKAVERSGAMKRSGLVCYAVLAAMLVIPLVHVGCPAPPAPGPPPPLPFTSSIIPEDALYLPGEEVEMTLSLTNVSSNPLTVSPVPPLIQLAPLSEHEEVLFSQAAGTQSQEIAPGNTITVKFTWDQKDNQGQQVPPGWYSITFQDITVIPENEGRSSYHTTGARVLIQYPQGAMVRTIELGDSQTANEVTITLERVEMLATGVEFHTFIIPPEDYSPPAQPPPGVTPPPPPPAFVHIQAEYILNGIAKRVGHSSENYVEDDGIRLILGGRLCFDPVPSDANTLALRIITMDDWEGPWEFEIPLD
ncbi:MAG: hypothetical protein IBX67_02330 [Dehalococcoidia bacterium]|nr:hypothetical protein [Dehalococcoidia bacterium]